MEGKDRKAAVSDGETFTADLRADGFAEIPYVGSNNFRRKHWHVEVPLHRHPGCLEIIYCRRGELTLGCRKTRMPFRPKTLFVVGPTVPHHICESPKGLSTYALYLRLPKRGGSILGLPAEESKWLIRILRTIPPRPFAVSDSVPASFSEIILALRMRKRPTERRFRLRRALVNLLYEIVQSARSPFSEDAKGKLPGIIGEMRLKPGLRYPAEEIARRTSLSISALNVRFRELTGLPPHAFLMSCRIERARRLLTQSEMGITEIAHELGFPSAQHFATQFKSAIGRTPSEFRIYGPPKGRPGTFGTDAVAVSRPVARQDP